MDKKQILREAIAGATTFVTMAYIIVVNPLMLSTQGTGMSFSGVLTATVLLSFVSTFLMGAYAKLPYGVAPGMGINAFFTFNLILGEDIPWQVALGIVFWSGILFFLLSVTPLRVMIVRAVPPSLRIGAAVGIGIFLTFIGLKNAEIVVGDPVTLVKLGDMTSKTLLCALGLVVALYLTYSKSPFAFIAAISSVTFVAWLLGFVDLPGGWWSIPDFTSVFFKADIWGALKLSFLPPIVAFMFTGLFDSLSSFVGVAQATKLVDTDGEPKNLKQGLTVDSLATVFAGLFGTSSGTAYIESYAGISVGGRTGLTAVFTALCFLPCLFLAPLVSIVPPYACAPVLILVGCFMFQSIADIRFEKIEEIFPAFLTLVLIPLTFSITEGVMWGFAAHLICFSVSGRWREIHPILFAIVAAWLGLFFV